MENIEQIARDCFSALCNGHLMLLDSLGIVISAQLSDQLVPVLFDHEADKLLNDRNKIQDRIRRPCEGVEGCT